MRNPMRNTTSFALAFILFSLSVLMINPASSAKAEETTLFRHAVFFKFKDDASAESVKAIEDAFAALPSKIDTIIDYEWGTSQSVEGLNDGFTHCFFVTFKDQAGLETYIPHPAHEAFVALLKPSLDKVFVFDYVPNQD